MRLDSLDIGHFEALYERNPDPWHFASSEYERAKYAATLAALPRERYARALDVGCSIGVFTEALADRCDDLLGIEPVVSALDHARARCARKAWVRFAAMFVPGDWPQEQFDLIVISEVLDYLGTADLDTLGERLMGSLAPGGDLILVHWVGKKRATKPEDEASDKLIARLAAGLQVFKADRNADYRLDVLRHTER